MWLLLSIIVAICWGLVLACVKKAYKSFSPSTFVIVGSVSAVAILLPFALINHGKITYGPLLPVATLVCALFLFEFYALEKGKLSLTGTVLNLYPFFTLLFAGIFLGESISVIAKFGVGLILVGLILISLEDWSEIKAFRVSGWLYWGLAGAFASGFGDFLVKLMIDDSNPYSYSLAFVVGWLFIALLLLTFDRKHIEIRRSKDLVYLILGTVFLFIGYIFLHLALKSGKVSIVTPITASSAAISLLLAFVWLKEKVTKYQIAAVFLIVLGVVLVCL